MIYRVDVFGRKGGAAVGGARGEVRRAGLEGGIGEDGEVLAESGSVREMAREAGVAVDRVVEGRVFFIETPDDLETVRRLALPLLGDPVVELVAVTDREDVGGSTGVLEIHLKPGVMDPVAGSAEQALRQAGLQVRQVRTGRSFRFWPAPSAEQLSYLGSRVLGNAVIEAVHLARWLPTEFPTPRIAPFELRHVGIRELDDEQLKDLSRNGHLFLNLTEMKAIQAWYREQGRDPTDIELETLAQTWSEHCVHKTLKSAVEVEDAAGGNRRYGNLIKETIFASTQQLIAEGKKDFCLSVFKDNAGVIAFDETYGVCFKVETHNRPSAIDPYGGAATGAGGCIRDVLGTGLGARPIANTDVFCVAYPDRWRMSDVRCQMSDVGCQMSDVGGRMSDVGCQMSDVKGSAGIGSSVPPHPTSNISHPTSNISHPTSNISPLPPGVLHPKRTLTQVVAGVRDYGNRMGIPTINGAVFFDDRYVANPLVFCGCVGLLPRDRLSKQATAGDYVVVIGGRTGRDGIHGATFSSAELTSTHADEFSHAVQIGNAITQKKMMDVVLQAAERGLFTAITDCGAGGLSSAVGEMGEKLGAEVHLDRVPLKYAGLRYDEIWISEAQERMVVSVPPHHAQQLLDLAKSEEVEATVIGHFGTENAELKLYYEGTEVGRLGMSFLHEGIPMPTRKAVVRKGSGVRGQGSGWWSTLVSGSASPQAALRGLLSHPNIASKHFIIRQYDHEVQGMSQVKPLVGPGQRGPSDGSVLRPVPSSRKGVAVGCGMAPWVADPYQMALEAIDEAVRNVVAVGGDPDQTAILDNFCWPGTDNPEAMGDLVRTAEACRDAALAYRIPFISGKDSLHNQYTNKQTGEVTRIPNTLLVSAISIVPDAGRCVTMDLKRAGSRLMLIGPADEKLSTRIAVHRYVAGLIRERKVSAVHDVSDGGWLTAVAEMCIGGSRGAELATAEGAFDALVASYIVECGEELVAPPEVLLTRLGVTSGTQELSIGSQVTAVSVLAEAWLGSLNW